MMKGLRIIILTIISVWILVNPSSIGGAGRVWELVRPEKVVEARVVAKDVEIEVRALNGSIYVTTAHQVQIKVFTILGQLVSQETLPAGTSQLNIGTHGVFIIKAGDFTCKVAL